MASRVAGVLRYCTARVKARLYHVALYTLRHGIIEDGLNIQRQRRGCFFLLIKRSMIR
jgi:hypothetical protein